MFPDGSGVAFDPFQQTYSASGGDDGGVGPAAGPAPGPAITVDPGPPQGAGGWPEGLAPQPVGMSGLPAHVTDPNAFVKPPDQVSPDGEPQPVSVGGAPTPSAEVEAQLRAQLEASVHPGAVTEVREPERALTVDEPGRPDPKVMLFGTGIPLQLSAQVDDNGWIWKVACKTGTLALSPGPGQIDMDVPLELTPELFDDVVQGFKDKAFPYVTVPETHANGSLENTGYVKAIEKLSKAGLMADARISPEGKAHVQGDPEDTEYLLTGILFTDPKAKEKALDGSIPDVSVGIKSAWREKMGGKTFRHALEHLSLTPVPWHPGLIPFNPAVALGTQPFDQSEPDGDVIWYTEPGHEGGLDLATRIQQEADDSFDPAAARAQVLALRPGDRWSWGYDVEVCRPETGDGVDGDFFLIRAPDGDADDGGYADQTLVSGIEAAMSAVVTGVAVCQQRRANMEAGADQAAPAVASYSADEQEDDEELLLAVSDIRASADGDEDTLSLSASTGSLETDSDEVQRMPETETPTSVEQLLAQHQARIDQLESELEERDTRLSAATTTIESQGSVVHRNAVNDTIRKLQGKIAPGLLLAAREIMLKDESWKGLPEGGGLNLSVQAPKADGTGVEDRAIQTPTELALFLLGAAPALDNGGQAAVQLASIAQGLDDFNLSAHEQVNDTPEAAAANAKSAVEEWAKQAHPEWFDAQGNRIAA